MHLPFVKFKVKSVDQDLCDGCNCQPHLYKFSRVDIVFHTLKKIEIKKIKQNMLLLISKQCHDLDGCIVLGLFFLILWLYNA